MDRGSDSVYRGMVGLEDPHGHRSCVYNVWFRHGAVYRLLHLQDVHVSRDRGHSVLHVALRRYVLCLHIFIETYIFVKVKFML